MLPICKTFPFRIFSFPELSYHPSISTLGLARDAAHEASSKTPKSLIIRARKWFFLTLQASTDLRCHRRNTTNLPGSPLRTKSCVSCEFRSGRIFEPH
jgi:hypothetical protein